MQDPGTKIYIARKSDTACKHLACSFAESGLGLNKLGPKYKVGPYAV